MHTFDNRSHTFGGQHGQLRRSAQIREREVPVQAATGG
jgi:hypothetical protein